MSTNTNKENIMKTQQYRFDVSGSVYEYDTHQDAYVFIGKLNDMSQRQFIKELEEERAFGK